MAEILNETNFTTEVLEEKLPVLVDFFATWCGPCRMMAPVIDEISAEADGKYKVFKVDIDECENLARQFKIRGVPTFIAFDQGDEIARVVGATTKENLLESLGQ